MHWMRDPRALWYSGSHSLGSPEERYLGSPEERYRARYLGSPEERLWAAKGLGSPEERYLGSPEERRYIGGGWAYHPQAGWVWGGVRGVGFFGQIIKHAPPIKR